MDKNTVLEQDTDAIATARSAVVTNEFAQDVARYFKTFLETDLRGRLQPARQVRRQRQNGLSTQLYINKYPQLNKNLTKNFISGFVQEAFVISQNKYATHGDERVSEQFARSIENLDDPQIDLLTQSLARAIDRCRVTHSKQYDAYAEHALQAVRDLIAADLVVPMLHATQGATSPDTEADELPLETDATEKVFGSFLQSLQTLVELYFVERQSFDILLAALQQAISLPAIRLVLREFLNEMSVADAYQEIYQLHRNNHALVESDLYLYFCEVVIGELSFPLFYMPLKSDHAYASITFSFENRIFVNTKALEFVLKEYNRLMHLDIDFAGVIDSIIHIDERKRKDILPQLQSVIDVLSNTFGLDKSLKLDNTAEQATTVLGVGLNNRLQVAIFDKANDAVTQDYEEILTPGSKAGKAFAQLVDDFVLRTPARYVQEVAEEWNGMSMTEKLLSSNPVSLNDEQRQALLALEKQESKVVVVNGASGTGKSHLVSGVVAQALLDGQSTLVLSDTPAVLDTVESSVTQLLGNVRGNNDYHNPILRFGRTSEDFLEDVEGQFLQNLRKFHELYSKLQSELRTSKNRKIQDVADQLAALSQSAENVNLHEVEQIVNNELKFGGREWIQDEPIEQINSDLQKLHQAIQYIRKSEANYLLPYIESSQQKTIAAFINIIREYERANKNVNKRLPEFIVRYRKLLPEQKTNLQSSLSYIHSNYRQYIKILNDDGITAQLDISDNTDFRGLAGKEALLNKLIGVAADTRRLLGTDKNQNTRLINELLSYETPPQEIIAAANNYIEQVVSLRSKIFGFSGRTLVIENLTKQLKKSIPQFSLPDPEKNMDDLQQIVNLVGFVIEQLAQLGLELDYWKEVLHLLKTDGNHVKELQKIIASIVQPAEFEFMAEYKINEADNLLANISLLQYASEMNDVFRDNPNLATLFGIKTIGQVLKQPDAYSGRFNKLAADLDDVKQLEECKKIIKLFIKNYPDASRRLGVNFVNGNLDIIDDTFAGSTTEEIKEYLAFKKKEQDITMYFKDMIADSYGRSMNDLEQMTALQMSRTLDAKIIKYAENQANDFNTIKLALKTKQQLSPQLFDGLQNAYPCMLADIREYALYVPLKSEQFDIVIIDEASRISVAEALPALLRAKKIIVLGDEKQFTSSKAREAGTVLNEMFRGRMLTSLAYALRSVPADTKNAYLAKAEENFDVKNSILNFSKFIANNEITLTKYFRSSPELISYNDKKFYEGSLKNLKARALPLNESVKFEYVTDNSNSPTGLHTNLAEAKHIIASLNNMREAGYAGSIGIITPYFEQAVLIQAQIDEGVTTDWFEQRNVKVMTFDTSQGEVRDYVFYSMVSNKHLDRQMYVFPADIQTPTGSLGEQRLVVGLSRATSVVHFVLSKPVEDFSGETRAVLEHYQAKLLVGASKSIGNTTDILTAGESLLPQYFYATKFYKKFTDRTRLITQFSLGDLLRPLVPRYRHPSYKVDFMVVFGDQRIIITYDEFRDNFLMNETGKEAATYLTPADIYYQKVLEGYGYKFLRLNKFNLGSKPIEMLDKLLTESVKKSSWPKDNGFLL